MVRSRRKSKKTSTKKPAFSRKLLSVRPFQQFHKRFIPYETIQEYISRISYENSDTVYVNTIGTSKTYPILLVSLMGPSTEKHSKTSIMVEAGLNGWDWIAVASALNLIDYLLRHQETLHFFEYHIIPCANPFGYNMSFKKDNLKEVNLANSYPVMLGISDLDEIDLDYWTKSLQKFKNHFVFKSSENIAVLRAYYALRDRISMFISLQAQGEGLVWPARYIDYEKKVRNSAEHAALLMGKDFKVGTLQEVYSLDRLGNVVDFLALHFEIPFIYLFDVCKNKIGLEDHKRIIGVGDAVVATIKSLVRKVFLSSVKPSVKPHQENKN